MRRDYLRVDVSVRPGARRFAQVVMVVAGSVFLVGLTIVGKALHKTHGIGWKTPAGSVSLGAGRHVQELFPDRMRGAIMMAVEAKPGTASVLAHAVEEFSRNVSDSVKRDSRVQPYAPIVVGYYLFDQVNDMTDKVKAELVTADHRMTLIIIQPTKMEGSWEQASTFLEEFCYNPPQGFTLHITGMKNVLEGDGCYDSVHGKVDTRNMNIDDLFRAELVTIPVALVIFGKLMKYYVKLLLVPLLTVIVSFILSCALMLPWMDTVLIPKDAFAIMGSVTLAFSLDYALFFLTRFSEQHFEGWPLQRNVDTIVSRTGKTILISGTLVAIAFFGSMILPEDNLKGTGFFMGIATISCMITSTMLIPAVLLIGGKILTGSIVKAPVDFDLQGFSGCEELSECTEVEQRQHQETSHWLRLMRLVDRGPVAAITIVFLLMSPVMMSLPHLSITGDRFALMPMGMPAMQALRRVQEFFPVGILDPYTIVITAPSNVASAQLSQEIYYGFASLREHDVKSMGDKVGLSAAEVALFEKVVKNIDIGHMDGKATNLVSSVNCSTLAAMGAGVALGVKNVHGVSHAHVLKAALRAAKNTGCATSDVEDAVAASASALYAGKDAGIPQKVEDDTPQAIRTEALKLGLSQAAADNLAKRVGEAAHDAHDSDEFRATLAAVTVGAAVGSGRLHGVGDIDSLKSSLHDLQGLHVSLGQAAQVLRAAVAILQKEVDKAHHVGKEVKAEAVKQGLNEHAAAMVAASLMAVVKHDNHAHNLMEKGTSSAPVKSVRAGGAVVEAHTTHLDKDFDRKWNLVLDIAKGVDNLAGKDHGTLLMPSGFAAMLDLCHGVQGVGHVASMLGPVWGYNQHIDWVMAVAMQLGSASANAGKLYHPLLDSHVNGNHALLEVHTTFPSIGPGGADWVLEVRKTLVSWEAKHPGYKAELSGGASEAADTRRAVLESMWSYLSTSVALIMGVVFFAFRSVMIPLRLAFALFFTMAATYGVAVIVYQTPLLHGLFPWLAAFHGLTFEVVPMVTGVAIALGLDYDILLVTRIMEFRLQGFTDRASVFRGATKAGGVISGAGLIMALAFTGLCFSDKLLMQQFGVLLVTSVLFDTFVVRTVLVPALMLVAQDWNWWPRRMPPAYKTSLEGEVEEDIHMQYHALEG